MSAGPQNFKGRPNTDSTDTLRILRYCGGGGGGGCPDLLGATHIIIPIRVPRYITYNRKIILNNNEFFGFRIFQDAGSDGLCDHSYGAEQSFWMGLSADSAADPESTAKAGVELSGALPYEVEFPANKCPQPTDAAWENIVYVYVWWGDATMLNESGFSAATIAQVINESSAPITLVKHDKDSKQ